MMKKIPLFFGTLFIFIFNTHSMIASEKLYREVDQSILQSQLKKKQAYLSVIFDSKIKNNNIDKIKLKKTIASSLAVKYRVASPIKTQQFFKNHSTNLDILKRDKSLLQRFFSKTKTDILVHIGLQEKGNIVFAEYRILGKNGRLIGYTTQSFLKVQFSKQSPIYEPKILPTLFVSSENNLGDLLAQQNLEDLFEQPTKAIDDFVSRSAPFAENGSAWSFYLPTAYFPVRTHNLEVNFSIEDLRFAKIQGESYRYLLGNSLFEFSTNLQTRNSSLYQGFVGIKAGIFQGDDIQFPFRIALGLRTLWQKESSKNNSTEGTSREDERKKLRRLSFFAVVSGNIPSTNIIYNIYLDNYTTGGGIRYKLPHKIFLFADSRLDYESEATESFLAWGFEHFPSDSVGYTFAYKTENRKIEDSENTTNESKTETLSLLVFGIKVSF